jgi:hypothetical protein
LLHADGVESEGDRFLEVTVFPGVGNEGACSADHREQGDDVIDVQDDSDAADALRLGEWIACDLGNPLLVPAATVGAAARSRTHAFENTSANGEAWVRRKDAPTPHAVMSWMRPPRCRRP